MAAALCWYQSNHEQTFVYFFGPGHDLIGKEKLHLSRKMYYGGKSKVGSGYF